MFGLSLEKLVLVAIVAGVLIGPHRLAHLARNLSQTVRSLRAFVEASRSRAELDLGVPLTRAEWEQLDLGRFDPRRIVREALADSAPAPRGDTQARTDAAELSDAAVAADSEVVERARPLGPEPAPAAAAIAESAPPSIVADPAVYPGLDCVRPGQRYLVLGDAAHPRRIALASLPADDPRRVRAETVIEPAAVVVPEAAAAAHPRRILIAALPEGAPRRPAAEALEAPLSAAS